MKAAAILIWFALFGACCFMAGYFEGAGLLTNHGG